MTELGPLPEEWGVVKFDAVVLDILTGDWGETNPGPDLQQCYVLRGTDFYQALKGSFTNTPIRYLKTSSIQKRQLRDGDILIELSGGSKDQPTGRIMIVNHEIKSKSSLPLVFSNFVKRLNVKTDFWPEFFWQYWEHLYQNGVTRIYEKRTTGIRNFKLNDFLASEHIPLPPLPEQKAIAGVLSTIQKAIEAQDKIIAAARELKKSLMRHLFTYGPVPIAEAEKVPLKETEIGPVPEHWDVVAIGDVVASTQYGISLRGNQDGKYPILRMNNLVDGHVDNSDLQYVDLENDDFQKFRVNKGDILFNRTNSYKLVGKTAIFESGKDYVFASYLVKAVTDHARLHPWYLNYYLNCEFVQDRLRMLATRGVSQSNINATKLRGFRIPLPLLAEQQETARILLSVDKKIETEEKRRESLQTLFKTMLHLLMTGQVRVKELEGQVV